MIRLVFERAGKRLTIAQALPYWLTEIDGLSELDCTVETERAGSRDGAVYRGAAANARNITLRARIVPPAGMTHEQVRAAFFAFFVPRQEGTLYVYEDGNAKRIAYRTERCAFEQDGVFREVKLSLLCCDPLFYELYDEHAYMAETTGLIEWPLALPPVFEAGTRNEALMASVRNDSDVARGMTVTFSAAGEVVHPGLTEVTRQESLCVRITMHAGDKVIVTTGVGNKRVRLLRQDTETNINHLWTFGGTWLQVEPGENVFRCTAESGERAMEVTVASAPAYWGA